MAKSIVRLFQNLFGSTAYGLNQVGEFGSLKNGSPTFATDASDIQTNTSNFTGGWEQGVVGQNYPSIEDRNALDCLLFYQLAYLLQQGVAEYDPSTTYYAGSIVAGVGTGILYVCINDDSGDGISGKAPTNAYFWLPYRPGALNPQVNSTLAGIAVGTWVAESSANEQLQGIAWSPKLGIFCGVGTSALFTSSDGKTWTSQDPITVDEWSGICWSAQLQLFVAVATSGTTQVATSPDGINWTAQTAAASKSWANVCWSPELQLLCAVSTDSSSAGIMTSPDGVTWTSQTSASGAAYIYQVCWSSGLGLFVAVMNSGVSAPIMTSPDGVNWTARAVPSGVVSLVCIAWCKEIGLFVAGGQTNSTALDIVTSPDGINWTAQTAPNTNGVAAIAWSPELGMIVASAGNGFFVSQNGITWSFVSVSPQPTAVVWSPQLGIFAASAYTGSAYEAIISTYVKQMIA